MGRTIRNPYVEDKVKEVLHEKDRKRGGARNRTEELLSEWEEDLEFYEREDEEDGDI